MEELKTELKALQKEINSLKNTNATSHKVNERLTEKILLLIGSISELITELKRKG